MKSILWYILIVAGLALGTGCGKKEAPPKEMKSSDASPPETVEVANPVPAKTPTTPQKLSGQAQAVASSLTVKAEDVMGELNQSVEQIKEKVATYDKTQLLAYVDQYKTVILEKKDQIAALTSQLKEVPITGMMGEKAKGLKDQLSQYTSEFSALKERYSVYLQQLKTFGVDLSAYGL